MASVTVIVKPRGAITTVLAGRSYIEVIYAAAFATRCERVCIHVLICGTRVYDIKHI